jgi:hypothetical protein
MDNKLTPLKWSIIEQFKNLSDWEGKKSQSLLVIASQKKRLFRAIRRLAHLFTAFRPLG